MTATPVSFSMGKDSSFMGVADLGSAEQAFEHYEELKVLDEPLKLHLAWPGTQHILKSLLCGLEGLPKDLVINTEQYARYRIPAHKNAVDYRLKKSGFKSAGGFGSCDSKNRGTFIYDYGHFRFRDETVEVRLIKNNKVKGQRRLFLDVYKR
jgi:hypothetical protein